MGWFGEHLVRNKARCLEIRDRLYPQPLWPGEIYLAEMRREPGDVLVEIGCGWRANMLRRASDQFRLKVGIDPDCRPNPELDDSFQLIVGDASTLPMDDNSVDVVAMNNVAEHLEDPHAVFNEARRVLRPGGRFIISTVNQKFPPIVCGRVLPHGARVVINKLLSGTAEEDTFPTYYRANSLSSLRRLGHETGFDEMELSYISHHPTYLLFSPIVYRMGIVAERVVRHVDALAWLRHMIQAVYWKPGRRTPAENGTTERNEAQGAVAGRQDAQDKAMSHG